MSKITDNSNEMSFHQLTSASRFLMIPLFQRTYSWSQKQLQRMLSEIEKIGNGEDSGRFLGAIIAVTRPTNPSQPDPYEIVDGQQRLTTLYLLLLVAAQEAARCGYGDYARGLLSTNLIVDWAQDLPFNTKLQPSFEDRAQFRSIFNTVSKTGELSEWLPLKLRVPDERGSEEGPLKRQYNRIRTYLRKKIDDIGFEALQSIVEIVRNNLTFVFILLKEPGSATTVFEGLNDPGIPISVGDLVKNEVFAKVGYTEGQAKIIHKERWIPFRNTFGDSFDDYFFPYAVIHKSNASRTDMFSELRRLWKNLSAEETIEQLGIYSVPFLALKGNTSSLSSFDTQVRKHIQRLVDMKHPSSTYPFLMRLLKSLIDENISKKDVIEVLCVIESFLVRRAICGIEPTGLLGLFRTLWSATEGKPNKAKVESVILKRLTVEWPNDARLRESIFTRPLYGSSIAKFVILEYNRDQGMDHPSDDWSIEHIMPQKYSEEWNHIPEKRHEKLKHLWANLVPLSIPMNSTVAQWKYEKKRTLFEKESMFTSTRQLAKQYNSWTEEDIEHRSEHLVFWAKARWPRLLNDE